MSNIVNAFGLIALIIFISLIVAAYGPVMGSTANDAAANNISSGVHNVTYQQGTHVIQGLQGVDEGIVFIIFCVLIVVIFLLMFSI